MSRLSSSGKDSAHEDKGGAALPIRSKRSRRPVMKTLLPPNGWRLSCGAEREESQLKAYHNRALARNRTLVGTGAGSFKRVLGSPMYDYWVDPARMNDSVMIPHANPKIALIPTVNKMVSQKAQPNDAASSPVSIQ